MNKDWVIDANHVSDGGRVEELEMRRMIKFNDSTLLFEVKKKNDGLIKVQLNK